VPTPHDGQTTPDAGTPAVTRAATSRPAIDALLREHPDALLWASTPDGKIVPIPEDLGLAGYPRPDGMDGHSGIELFVAEDRMTIVDAWLRAKEEGVAQAVARLRTDPDQWIAGRMLDLRDSHGVVLSMTWPIDGPPDDEEVRSRAGAATSAPRFCTRRQDPEGKVISCDDAYVQMFGYSIEEVMGRPTFEFAHPDDQARVIEGWVGVVSTGRVQMFRVRMRRADDTWLWVDTTLHSYLDDPEQPHVIAECIDVSNEMEAQQALADREELLRHLIEEMPDGLLQLDAERSVLFHNTRLLEILHASDAPGGDESLEHLLSTVTEEGRQRLHAAIDRVLGEGVREEAEVQAALPHGGRCDILVKFRPLQRDSGETAGVIASVLDVTDSARARRELERMATYDALTGVHNRASIVKALEIELAGSSATGVAYIDLDHFKSINDTLGHAAGDEVLVHAAKRMKAAMRASDELGRLGGDEFLILLRGVSGLGVAMAAAQRIADSVRGEWDLPCGSVELCASIGVACADAPGTTAEQLVERADAAMYRSKQKRRGVPVLAA
jgi:diguanylate cyclase (GGDEF)-like protein/PAS domain S-box-containing protein